MVYYLIPFFAYRIVLAPYALQVFLHTMIISCCCVLGDSYSYVSKATQILELGVSEFCSTVPNSHVTSRVCFRILSQNSQRGNCKVEFYQPSCWLYSVPNLLVFLQLVTLYLGVNHVRVVSERV